MTVARTLPLLQAIPAVLRSTTQCHHGAMGRAHMDVDVDVILSSAASFDFMNRRGASDDSVTVSLPLCLLVHIIPFFQQKRRKGRDPSKSMHGGSRRIDVNRGGLLGR